MNSFLKVKVDKCGKKSTILFLVNYPRINKKFEQYPKAEFIKWFFHFNIIKLRFKRRYHHMNNNSKCDINFFQADK